jgi:hypothetical protein
MVRPILKGRNDMGNAALKLINPPSSLQVRAAEARAKVVSLEQAASDAEETARRAQLSFEEKPSAETHANVAVTDQLARNARKLAQSYAAEVLGLLNDADRERRTDELASLLPQVDGSAFETQRRRLDDIVAEFRRALRGAVVDLDDALTAHNAVVSQVNRLAEGLGRNERHRPRNVHDVLAAIVSPFNAHAFDPKAALLALEVISTTGAKADQRLRVEINMPIYGGTK